MPRKGPAATISNSRQGYLLGLKPENARGLAATRAAGLMPWGLTQSCSWGGPPSIEEVPDSPKLAEVMVTFPSPSACYARAWVIFQAMHGVENFAPTNQVTFGGEGEW